MSVERRAKRDHAQMIAMMAKSEFAHISQRNNQPSQGKEHFMSVARDFKCGGKIYHHMGT